MQSQRITLTCRRCNQPFSVTPYRAQEAKFCSNQCRWQFISPSKPLEASFWPRVNTSGPVSEHCPDLGPCWLWLGPVNRAGYGLISVKIGRNWRRVRAHRVSLQIAGIELPEGLMPDHLCRVRNCVRPSHLEVVDNRTNTLRGISPSAQNAKKTHCVRGHPFSAENTIISRIGNRKCRACEQARDRAIRIAAARLRPPRRPDNECQRGHVGEMRVACDGRRRCYTCSVERDHRNYEKRKRRALAGERTTDA